jgi:hypothetical protein
MRVSTSQAGSSRELSVMDTLGLLPRHLRLPKVTTEQQERKLGPVGGVRTEPLHLPLQLWGAVATLRDCHPEAVARTDLSSLRVFLGIVVSFAVKSTPVLLVLYVSLLYEIKVYKHVLLG